MLIFLNIFLVYVLTMHKFFIVLPSFCFLIISQSYGKICDNYFFVAQFDETWNIYHNKSFSFFLLLNFPYQFFKTYIFSVILCIFTNYYLLTKFFTELKYTILLFLSSYIFPNFFNFSFNYMCLSIFTNCYFLTEI